jgi:hypothetical protein
MIKINDIDKDKYGEKLYHHKRKQGNHRWDCTVNKDERGVYTVIFRHSYSKKYADGVKRTLIRDEAVVRANNASELLSAKYPDYKDVGILKSSNFFKEMQNSNNH